MGKQCRTWFLAVSLFPFFATAVRADTEISVPADPVSTYTLISLRRVSEHVIEIEIKRDAPMTGTSYSKREIDCRKQVSRLAGEGSTPDAMEGDTDDESMDKLVEGTVPYDLAQYACANAPR